jgi:signal transduction histidine kinase
MKKLIVNLGIKTKLIVAVSFLMIAIIVAIAYFTIAYFESETKQLIATEQFAKVSNFAGEADDKLQNLHDMLMVLSKAVPPDLFKNPGKARAFLNEHAELHKFFDNGLYLFDKSGILVSEAPQVTARIGRNFSYRQYVSITLSTRKPYVSDPYFSTMPDRHPSIMLTAPVFGPQGEMLGILSGGIDLVKDNILSRMMSMKVGKTGYFYIITRDRRIILHPDKQRILQQDVPAGANRLLEKAIAGFEGTDETINSRGLHSVTSFKRLKIKDWLVAANYPVAEAYAPVYQAEKILLTVIVMTILVVPSVVWFLMNLLTKPLLSFTRHVESMPGQKGEARLLPVSSSDEIGRLTEAFNHMVIDLDRKQAEVQARQEEVEKLLREIGEFNHEIETLMFERTMSLMALTVADRIRNPASLIAGVCSRIAEKEEIGSSLRENLGIISESSKKLEGIVRDFQSLLKSKQTMFTREDLNRMVEGSVSVITGEAAEKGVALVLKLSEGPLMINTRASLLRIAILHILKNGIEATPRDGAITITTAADGENAVLTVRDTGHGIPEDIVGRIFDPFFTTKERSYGMGLPLVRQVISEHMGEISVISKEGEGAAFRISLPTRWKQV